MRHGTFSFPIYFSPLLKKGNAIISLNLSTCDSVLTIFFFLDNSMHWHQKELFDKVLETIRNYTFQAKLRCLCLSSAVEFSILSQ